jgi:cbb3-type cytochrome oxidase subunit 3
VLAVIVFLLWRRRRSRREQYRAAP